MKCYNHIDGYVETVDSENNRILEHRLVMQNVLGRKLYSHEIVHHIDGNKKNNVPENLKIMSREGHTKIHSKCTEHVSLNCMVCNKSYDIRKKLYEWRQKQGQKIFVCSKRCGGELNKRHLPHNDSKKDDMEFINIIKQELTNKLTGYAISKKHDFNNKTVYKYIKLIQTQRI